MNYEQRISRIVEVLDEQGLDAFITSHLVHVRYVSGFSGSNATVLLTRHGATLFTDGRYGQQARSQSPHCSIVIQRDGLSAAVALAAKTKALRIGFESQHITFSTFRDLSKLAEDQHFQLQPTTNLIEDFRTIKDDDEIKNLETACEITDASWSALMSEGVLGKSEKFLAGRIEMLFRELGGEDRAFESIVATGPHSAIPHHEPTDRIVAAGDFLKIDCGARFAGYHADMTRTVVVGKAAAWQKEIYQVVLAAQSAAKQQAKPGVEVLRLDHLAREVVEAAGFGEQFLHLSGHGVGLEIHERPFLGRHDGILTSCMPITIEPGIYLEGRGGVRIEDTLLIVEDGYRNLTNLNRELLEL